MPELTVLEPSISTEYVRHVWKHWWVVVVGGVGGILTAVSLVASIIVPTWLGVAVLLLGLSVAQFLAFKDLWHERNQAQDEMRKTVAPLSGMTFAGQTLRLADIGRDLIDGGHKSIVNGRRFEDCTIVGPGFMMIQGGAITHCIWEALPDALLITVAEDRELFGVVLLLDCAFERCRFENVGLLGSPAFAATFQAGITYADKSTH